MRSYWGAVAVDWGFWRQSVGNTIVGLLRPWHIVGHVTVDASTPPGRLLAARRAEILALANRHGATSVHVFGSVARGDAGPESDLDLLVTFAPSASVFARLDLQDDLKDLLGIAVDITTPEALHRVIRDDVLREAVPV